VRASWIAPLVVLASSGAAAATPATARLVVDAPSTSCVQTAAIDSAVAAKLGRDPFVAESASTIEVTVTPTTTGLRARVERRDGTGSRGVRELDVAGDDCASAVETIALMIAIALDPIAMTASAPPPASPPAPVTAPIVTASRVDTVARVETPAAPAASHRTFDAGVAMFGSLGAVPGPTAGLAIAGSIAWRRFRLSLEARADLGASIEVPPGSVRGASRIFVLMMCWQRSIELCGIAGGGWLHGEGSGFAIDRNDRAPLAIAGARIAWPVDVGSIWLVPSVDGLGNVISTHLDLDGSTKWTSPPVQVVVALGVRVSL
jgi:hypothetical protein